MADITERTKVKVTIGCAFSLMVTVAICTASIVGTVKDLRSETKDLRKELAVVRSACWQVGDQVQFSQKLDKANESLNVPDPTAIMRDRLISERANKEMNYGSSQ